MIEPPSQQAVFELLSDPASYGAAGAATQVKRHQTHAAMVFLAGDRALKVKRAVRYPFLDFSTLDKRKAACEAELQINRKFAPQLYRRLVPITLENDGALALGGAGEPIENARIEDVLKQQKLMEGNIADLIIGLEDATNVFGGPDRIRHKYAVLREHCDRLGRPYDEIERSTLQGIDLERDSPAQVVDWFGQLGEAGAQHVIASVRGIAHLAPLERIGAEILPQLREL